MKNEEKYKTIAERQKAFNRFCRSESCDRCPCCEPIKFSGQNCILHWLALKAEEEEPLRCPFCGGKSLVIDVLNYITFAVRCNSCHATSGNYDTVVEAIAAWNRRVR